MKIIRYEYQDIISYGVLHDNKVKQLCCKPFSCIEYTGNEIAFSDVKLLCPTLPSKIIAVGLNYKSHAHEMGLDLPKNPLIFLKPPSSVLNPYEQIIKPKQSQRVDYEAELAIVIGKECKNVSKDDALDYVFGFTCLNDVTARDLQKLDGQWTRAKSFDTFAPFGPIIETEFDWKDKCVKGILNGNVVQQGNTNDFIFDIPSIISFASSIMTLYPGDIIPTGTPSGIGPLVKGDKIEIEIEGIGRLTNTVTDAE